MTAHLKLHGEKELIRKIQMLAANIHTDALPVLEEGGRIILTTAQQLVPVKQGELKASLGMESIPGKQPVVRVGSAQSPSDEKSYAAAVEFGYFFPAQPFMRPAYDTNQDKVIKHVSKGLGEKITRRAKGTL